MTFFMNISSDHIEKNTAWFTCSAYFTPQMYPLHILYSFRFYLRWTKIPSLLISHLKGTHFIFSIHFVFIQDHLAERVIIIRRHACTSQQRPDYGYNIFLGRQTWEADKSHHINYLQSRPCHRIKRIMMTSSNGNIFRVTGPLWGEFTGHR